MRIFKDIQGNSIRVADQGLQKSRPLTLRNDKPLVSIIVPTKNSERTITECLRSLEKQTYNNMEIILVDNFSCDNTVQIAKRFGVKVFLKGPERSAQANFGATKARGKYVYRVDSDFVLQSNVVREAVEACENHGFDAIAVHNTSDPKVSFWAQVRKLERDCYRNDELNVAARFWKKEVFDEVGGLDETLIAAEDYDLQNRLVKTDFKIGRIKAEEVHIGEPTALAEVVRKHYYYGKNILRFIKKDPVRAPRQISPVRPAFIRNWRSFLKDPTLTVGFMLYQTVRYSAAVLGFFSSLAESQ